MLGKLIELLGEDNVQKIEDGITEMILEGIKDDIINNREEYIINPDDISEFAECCKQKAFAKIEDEVIKEMETKMRKALLGDE